jgi:hypothetical protein
MDEVGEIWERFLGRQAGALVVGETVPELLVGSEAEVKERVQPVGVGVVASRGLVDTSGGLAGDLECSPWGGARGDAGEEVEAPVFADHVGRPPARTWLVAATLARPGGGELEGQEDVELRGGSMVPARSRHRSLGTRSQFMIERAIEPLLAERRVANVVVELIGGLGRLLAKGSARDQRGPKGNQSS